jgi:putative acetyltransferase
MNSEKLEIRVGDLNSREVVDLLTDHLRALAEITPSESMHALDLDELRKPDLTFWSIWANGELLGCGALKELDHRHGEIKSMRTAKAHLRKGIGSVLMQQIIAEAKRRGYTRLSLETGATEYFHPAHRLYHKHGFEKCPPFGDYREDPNSVFMTRELPD